MRKLLILLAAVIITAVTAQARTFVLAAGVSNYGDEQANLSQTTKDTKRFVEVMKTQTKDVTILTSKYANRANIIEKLRAICNRAQAGDRVIFYFSGHGTSGSVVTHGLELLGYDEIVSLLQGSSASEKICFIDACLAGSMASSTKGSADAKAADAKVRAFKALPGHAFFVSSRADEYSTEDPLIGAGYFTQALIKGLRGKADADSNRKVTVKELFKYVYADVVRRAAKINRQQHPQLIAPKEMMNVELATW